MIRKFVRSPANGHAPGGTSSQPSRSARVASSVRDATSSRSNSRREVRLDGLRADPERRADLVVARGRRRRGGRRRARARVSRAIAGRGRAGRANAIPPAAARRIASRSSAIGAVLSTNPAAPSRSAASAYCG